MDGAGRRHEWLRTPSSVSRAEVERRERDVGAVDGVVVAARAGTARTPPRDAWPAGPCPQSWASAIASVERHAQAGGPGDAGGDLRDLDRVGEPGAEVVVFRGDEHLALAREPPPRTRVLDPVEVALEAQAERVGLLGAGARSRADRTGRAGRERRVELGLALLAPRTRRPT